jgi:hypothetical protein
MCGSRYKTVSRTGTIDLRRPFGNRTSVEWR